MSEAQLSEGIRCFKDSYTDPWSRDEVIKCPHMMALLGYLIQQHNLPRYASKEKGLRYHYTDAVGLLGIVETGRVWATDIRFLNDPSEGSYLPERLLSIMSLKSSGVTKTEQAIIDGIRDALQKPRWNHSTFCVSLSRNGDLLSQWRGYGSFGKGYAVGMDFLPHPQLAQYYDVVYGDDGLRELAVDLLDLFVASFQKWEDELYDEWAATLSVVAKSFKVESYSEEQESRLICNSSSYDDARFQRELPLNFRARGSDIVPYISMSHDLLRDDDEEPRLPIKRIVIGPGVDFDRNFSSVNALLKANSYEDVEIVPSAIPFRP
ncbi:DUF2971 domain-containing protein [Nitratireductor kimnyeongensis]|uniref:DUF2971 domain-containing protein n=1 Tax=Nitratireductor kimnyeongensis TaxID=430679 RepID=A0ABW0TE77_9HYPH|nr:DUF2971 domain-containing protein [Nitratireductor kimnyeongensis]QZZ37207.1 DUF2971 domain-containing protein [Nitratireductor kimnyeongensis]